MTSEIEFIDSVRAVVIFDDGIRASRAILDLPGGAEEYVLVPARSPSTIVNTVVVHQHDVPEAKREWGEHSVQWVAALSGASIATCIGILILMLSF